MLKSTNIPTATFEPFNFQLKKANQSNCMETGEEVVIWNTFINTRIGPSEEAPTPASPKFKAKGASTWRPTEPSMFDESNSYPIIFSKPTNSWRGHSTPN